MTRSDLYWATQYEKIQRDPIQGDFGPAYSLANPAGFRAYMVMARYDPRHTVHKVTDLYGRERWLNPNGWRVLCHTLGITAAGGGTLTTGELALQLGVCRQTISRWIMKLTAWGLIGSVVGRGRYGGITLFARKVADNLEHYASVARAKMAEIRARKSNVHPSSQHGYRTTSLPPYLSVSKGAHLDLVHEMGLPTGREKGMIQCPAHEDRQKSLSWRILPGGKVLLHCFAGCTFAEIVGTLR